MRYDLMFLLLIGFETRLREGGREREREHVPGGIDMEKQ